MPQMNYAIAPPPGKPGQVFDLSAKSSGDIVTECAGAIIPFGVAVELNASGLLVPVQDLTAAWPPSGALASTSFMGVSVYDPLATEQQYVPFSVPYSLTGSSGLGYPKGSRVPVLRRGRIWMAYDGLGTPNRVGAFNIWHSSDGTSKQGVATFSATSATVGAEIGAAPPGMTTFNDNGQAGNYTDAFNNAYGILCVSLNL